MNKLNAINFEKSLKKNCSGMNCSLTKIKRLQRDLRSGSVSAFAQIKKKKKKKKKKCPTTISHVVRSYIKDAQ